MKRNLKLKTDPETNELYLDLNELLDNDKKLISRVEYYKMETQSDKSIILTLYDKRKRKINLCASGKKKKSSQTT